MQLGTRIDEAGILLHEKDDFYLRRERGGRFRLEMRGNGLAEVGRPVRLLGVYVGNDLVDVTEIAAT